ncbi:MAG TPA: SDR family oxidoreductase [Solimonas sp.]|nr:SDR family oxidoreductase [Solimonas sp.]
MKNFEGKVAAITGAGSGIGRALAIELARRGAHLALSDVNLAGLRETVALLPPGERRVTQARVDVAQREQVYAWAAKTAKAHKAVHLVFNNAGVALGSPVDGMSDEDLQWIFDINFWGVVHGTRAFLPFLKQAGEGHIVNVSSVFGIAAVPSQGAYNASKFAVRGFTEALRQELELAGGKISATTVHPGGIKTNIARAARYSEAMESFAGKNADEGRARFDRLLMTSPERAAKVILAAVRANRRRVLIGPDAHLIDWTVRLMPERYQQIVTAFTRLTLA